MRSLVIFFILIGHVSSSFAAAALSFKFFDYKKRAAVAQQNELLTNRIGEFSEPDQNIEYFNEPFSDFILPNKRIACCDSGITEYADLKEEKRYNEFFNENFEFYRVFEVSYRYRYFFDASLKIFGGAVINGKSIILDTTGTYQPFLPLPPLTAKNLPMSVDSLRKSDLIWQLQDLLDLFMKKRFKMFETDPITIELKGHSLNIKTEKETFALGLDRLQSIILRNKFKDTHGNENSPVSSGLIIFNGDSHPLRSQDNRIPPEVAEPGIIDEGRRQYKDKVLWVTFNVSEHIRHSEMRKILAMHLLQTNKMDYIIYFTARESVRKLLENEELAFKHVAQQKNGSNLFSFTAEDYIKANIPEQFRSFYGLDACKDYLNLTNQ